MRRVFLLLPLLVLAGNLFGKTSELFDQGNKAYQAGDFATAKERYEGLVKVGNGGVALSLNLGNTYFRLGELGQARLWYERALEAAPREEDARYNRDIVRERVGDRKSVV